MALANKKANKDKPEVEFHELVKFAKPKTANTFIQSVMYAQSRGWWLTIGMDKSRSVILLTLKDSENEVVSRVSCHDNDTLEKALEEFIADMGSTAG